MNSTTLDYTLKGKHFFTTMAKASSHTDALHCAAVFHDGEDA